MLALTRAALMTVAPAAVALAVAQKLAGSAIETSTVITRDKALE